MAPSKWELFDHLITAQFHPDHGLSFISDRLQSLSNSSASG